MHDTFIILVSQLCSSIKIPLAVHGENAEKQVQIWKLDDYVPSLYSLNIAECAIYPQLINLICMANIGFEVSLAAVLSTNPWRMCITSQVEHSSFITLCAIYLSVCRIQNEESEAINIPQEEEKHQKKMLEIIRKKCQLLSKMKENTLVRDRNIWLLFIVYIYYRKVFLRIGLHEGHI